MNLTTSDIKSVYAGKPNKCCCGCSGIHRYNTEHAKSCRDGVTYNNAFIKKVLRIVKENAHLAETGDWDISVVIGTKLYVLYPIATNG